MKITFTLLWSTVIFSGISSSQGSLVSLDSLMQNAYIKAKEGLSLQNLTTTIADGNLYEQAYNVAQEQSTTAVGDAVVHATNSLNHLAFTGGDVSRTCNLESSDTIAMLYQVPWVAQELRQEISQSSRANNPNFYEEFWNGCNKLYACYNDEKVTDSRQTQFCKDIAVNAYNMGKIHSDIQNSLTNANIGSNIYADNNKTNGSFDLLVDIEAIGDVLFESNKEPAEILFFKLPTVSATQQGDGGGTGGPSNAPLGFGASTLLDGAGNGGSGENLGTGANSGTTSTVGSEAVSEEAQGVDDFINQNSTDNPIPQNLNGGLITNNVCIIPELDEIDPDDLSITEEQIDDFLQNIFNQQNNLLNDNLNPSPIGALFPANGGGGISNNVDAQRAIDDAQRKRACSTECQDNIDTSAAEWEQEMELSLCETNCCINACDGLSVTDKIICTTDCLCGEYASPNNIFRIKYCKIPVKGVSPLPRNVLSVEEIVDELSKLIKKLKEQGMPVKLAKPEEFMDSTNENLSFANLFAFDVFVKFKPMFESTPVHVKEEEKIEQLDRNNENILGAGKLINKAERNKYVMIDNSGYSEGSKNVKGELSDLRNNTQEADAQVKAELAEQEFVFAHRQAQLEQQANGETNAVVLDEIDLFLRHNQKFWKEIIDTLDGIGLSAKRIQEKVENEED